MLEDLLLELAIEKSNLDFIKFLFKNELKIINVVSQQEGTCHIPKTRDGQAVLDHAIDSGNAEVLNLLLQNINTEQSKLKPKSELYELCQRLKNNALDKAMDKSNEKLVTLLISATEKKQEISNVKEIKAGSGSNSNVTSKPTATSTQKTNPTTISNSGRRISSFTNVQPFKLSEKETKYKERKESFYTSLRSDVVGVIVTGLFIAAAVMVPSVAGAVVCSVVAVLVAIATGLHIANSTLPSYREMRENKVEPVNPITQTL